MIKKLIIIIIAVIIGIYIKNIYIESNLDSKIKEMINNILEQEPVIQEIKYDNVKCKGIINVNCKIHNIKLNLTNKENAISIKTIKIINILNLLKNQKEKEIKINIEKINFNKDILNNILLKNTYHYILKDELKNLYLNFDMKKIISMQKVELKINKLELISKNFDFNITTDIDIYKNVETDKIIKYIIFDTSVINFSQIMFNMYNNMIKEHKYKDIALIFGIKGGIPLKYEDFKEKTKKHLIEYYVEQTNKKDFLIYNKLRIKKLIKENKIRTKIKIINHKEENIKKLIKIFLTTKDINNEIKKYIKIEEK